MYVQFIVSLTKCFSVFSWPTTAHMSPKFAAHTLRTWKRESVHMAAKRGRKIRSVMSFPTDAAILLINYSMISGSFSTHFKHHSHVTNKHHYHQIHGAKAIPHFIIFHKISFAFYTSNNYQATLTCHQPLQTIEYDL